MHRRGCRCLLLLLPLSLSLASFPCFLICSFILHSCPQQYFYPSHSTLWTRKSRTHFPYECTMPSSSSLISLRLSHLPLPSMVIHLNFVFCWDLSSHFLLGFVPNVSCAILYYLLLSSRPSISIVCVFVCACGTRTKLCVKMGKDAVVQYGAVAGLEAVAVVVAMAYTHNIHDANDNKLFSFVSIYFVSHSRLPFGAVHLLFCSWRHHHRVDQRNRTRKDRGYESRKARCTHSICKEIRLSTERKESESCGRGTRKQ